MSDKGLRQAATQFQQFSPAADKNASPEERIFFAPGRVNLIGEHTDYNGGYVLPAALEMGTWLFARQRSDGRLRVASSSFHQVIDIPVHDLRYDEADNYANYPKGVIREFEQLGFDVKGFDLFLYGNLPYGAGLSSSASVEVATAWMLNEILGANLSLERIAQMAQAAENRFVGVNCGIMDQFAVALGRKNNAISLKCDTLKYELVPLRTDSVKIVIANTNKRRGLTDSKYNERRGQCEQALRCLQEVRANLKSLGDIEAEDWPQLESKIPDETILKRARHVVFENERAKLAAQVLRSGDIRQFGRMMNASHVSLRDDYEVTGSELDTLAEAAWAVNGCIGSRMTGAGFGGCTVSLVEADGADEFISRVTRQYTAKIGYEPSFYVTGLGDGVHEVTREGIACQF